MQSTRPASTPRISLTSFAEPTCAPLRQLIANAARSLGLPDSYPFAISEAVLVKLDFVRKVLRSAMEQPGATSLPGATPLLTKRN